MAAALTAAPASSGDRPVAGWLGVVVSRHASDLAASAPATVREILVQVGDPVRAGQLLAVLESPELDQQVVAARADLQAARADSSRARAELEQASAIFARREKASDVFTKEEMEGFATRKSSATAISSWRARTSRSATRRSAASTSAAGR
jgi:multidrug efflux pump subunit AcrA (membrane-fusion protein)